MLLQMAGGSELYPTLTGPIVLLVTALFVVLGPPSWSRFVGLIVPAVLGVGAIVAAAMTGEFTAQLTDVGSAAVALGSWMHLIGLAAGVAGGVAMLLVHGRAATSER